MTDQDRADAADSAAPSGGQRRARADAGTAGQGRAAPGRRHRAVPGRLSRAPTPSAQVRERVPRPAAGHATGERVGVTGRVMLSRNGGKLCFATIRDGTGEIQVMISLDRVGEQALAAWKPDVDLGDHIGVDRRGHRLAQRRAVRARRLLRDHRQGAAAAAGEAPGPDRSGVARPPALSRPDRQPRGQAPGRAARRGDQSRARGTARPRLP